MKIFLTVLFVSTWAILIAKDCFSQQQTIHQFPKVGSPIANYHFTNLVNFPKKEVSIADFKGKWLLLDFWSRGCAGCIASFPEMDKLGKQFKGRVQLVMIGVHNGKTNLTKKVFEFHQKKYNLSFTLSYELDQKIDEKFDLFAVPCIILVNPEGTIVAKTFTIDSLKLSAFLNGEKPEYKYYYSAHEPKPDNKFNRNLPLLTKGKQSNGGIDTSFIARSILVKWNSQMPNGYLIGFNDGRRGFTCKADAIGFSIASLLRISYTGISGWLLATSLYKKLYPDVIVELKNSTLNFDGARDEANLYSYSLSLPYKPNSPEVLRQKLRSDIETYFNFSSSIEEREVPAWKLVVIDPAKVEKLRTKGGKMKFEQIGAKMGIEAVNCPMDHFVSQNYFQKSLAKKNGFNYEKVPMIVNETGIDYNIDLRFEADMLDFDETKRRLNEVGLDFVKGSIKMNAIVVKEIEK